MTAKEATYFLQSQRVEELYNKPPKYQHVAIYGVLVAPEKLMRILSGDMEDLTVRTEPLLLSSNRNENIDGLCSRDGVPIGMITVQLDSSGKLLAITARHCDGHQDNPFVSRFLNDVMRRTEMAYVFGIGVEKRVASPTHPPK